MKILLRILRLALRHKWYLLGVYACMVGATISQLTLPRFFGQSVDTVSESLETGSSSQSAILFLVLVIFGLSAARGILSFGQTYLTQSLRQATVYDLRNRFYDHLQHLSFGFHDRHHTGGLMSRAITDVEVVGSFINVGLVTTPYLMALFIIVPIILLSLDWRLGLLSVTIMPVVTVVSAIIRTRLMRIWLAVQEHMAEMSRVLQENLMGMRVVKAFASEDFEEAKFGAKNREVTGGMVRAGRISILNGALMDFVFLGLMGLILWYGGVRAIGGHLTTGELAQFLFYMQMLSAPVRGMSQIVNSIARAMASGQRLFEILDAESPVRESAGAFEMPRVRGHVRFEDVSFRYDNGAQVLKNINVDAEPARVIALLGAPGSGKSSIVHLLPRFYDVEAGRVTIDGTDVRDVTLNSLRRNIGIVQQDVFLFTASIRDNIAYGREEATMEEVVQAARVAQLDEFIQGLDDGYDTLVGERGANLSGGQKQRVAIARAVLLDPPVLILDDSTSSVDVHTEELIRNAMESVMRGRTTFVIAHRLSTVHKADQILVLEDGQIVERGIHQELLALNGRYRRIYDLQLRPQEEMMLDVDVSVPGRWGGTR